MLQGFAVPQRSSVNGWRGSWASEEHDAPASGIHEVRGNDVAGSAVVNADEIVFAAFRIGDKIAVQQHDRYGGGVEFIDDKLIQGIPLRRQLERREEYA